MAICGGDGGFGFLPATDARIKSRDDWTIWCEIQAIQNSILNAISNCGYSAIVSNGTPMTKVSGISSIEVISGGLDYFPVVATAVFVHPSGTGAMGEVVHINGIIQSITVTDGGTGYEPIIALSDMTGLGNRNAYILPTVTEGVVVGVNIVSPGTGYAVGDNVAVVHPYGHGADLKVSQVGASGNILKVDVFSGGEFYATVEAQIEIDHPTGGGFAGSVIVRSGVIDTVVVNSGGMFYLPLLPAVVVTDVSGTGFRGEAVVVGGVIVEVKVLDEGSGYSDDAEASVIPAPTSLGRGAVLDVGEDACGECSPCATGHCPKYTPHDYYQVYSGAEENRIISDQLASVVSYFTKLGYTVRVMTNPDTGETIQWMVSW